MHNREKVIKGLVCCDYCNSLTNTCFQCPYLDLNKEKGLAVCTAELAHDALALLREQEPVEPLWHEYGPYSFWTCAGCDGIIDHDDYKFCPHCGRKVKWK